MCRARVTKPVFFSGGIESFIVCLGRSAPREQSYAPIAITHDSQDRFDYELLSIMGPKNLLAAAQAMPIPTPASGHWLQWALRRNGENEPRWADIDTIVRAASTKPAAERSVYIWDVSCKSIITSPRIET